MSILEQNTAEIIGEVLTMPVLSHTVYGEDFYLFDLKVNRLSDMSDVLPVLISEKLMKDVIVGAYVSIDGQIRTYNEIIDNNMKLIIRIFTNDIQIMTTEAYLNNKKPNNLISLNGHVCKAPIYRTTPFGREITDLFVAVNRSYHKSDYLPCITWGRNAKYAKSFEVGQKVELSARLQSREYQKKDAEGNVTTKMTYELSILNIKAL